MGAGCPGCLRRCHRFCGASGRLAAAPEDLSRSAGPQLALCRHAHPPAQLTEPFGADGLLQRPVPGPDQPAVGHSGPDKVSVHGL